MLVAETSPNNTIIPNPNLNWQWLTVSGKSVATCFHPVYICICTVYIYTKFI